MSSLQGSWRRQAWTSSKSRERPVSFILGRKQEADTINLWQQEFGIPVFTSATWQVIALRALGGTTIVDYDPTTGAPPERYFSAADFTVLHVDKVPVAWAGSDEIADDEAFDMLASFARQYPGADGLCLQGSSKWALNAIVTKIDAKPRPAVGDHAAAAIIKLISRGAP